LSGVTVLLKTEPGSNSGKLREGSDGLKPAGVKEKKTPALRTKEGTGWCQLGVSSYPFSREMWSKQPMTQLKRGIDPNKAS